MLEVHQAKGSGYAMSQPQELETALQVALQTGALPHHPRLPHIACKVSLKTWNLKGVLRPKTAACHAHDVLTAVLFMSF